LRNSSIRERERELKEREIKILILFLNEVKNIPFNLDKPAKGYYLKEQF